MSPTFRRIILPLVAFAALTFTCFTLRNLYTEWRVRRAPPRAVVLDRELKPNGPEAAHFALRDLAAPSFTASIILTHREAIAHRAKKTFIVQCYRSRCYLPDGEYRPALLALDGGFLAIELGALVGCALVFRRRWRQARGLHLPRVHVSHR